MSSWADLIGQADPEDHFVQLYGDDDQLLTENVSRYLEEGLRRFDGLIVIATPEHTEAIARHLAAEAPGESRTAEWEGRLVFRDARATLARFMVGDLPDEADFESVVGHDLEHVRTRSRSGRVRAFGEMVSLLWTQGRHDGAARLEGYWNALLARNACSLYCAYRIDLFGGEVDLASLRGIVGAHTRVFAGPRTIISSGRAHR